MYSFLIKLKINWYYYFAVKHDVLSQTATSLPNIHFSFRILGWKMISASFAAQQDGSGICKCRTFKNTFLSLHFFVSLPTMWTFSLQLWWFYGEFENDYLGTKDDGAEIQNESTPVLIFWNSCTNSGLSASCISLYKIQINLFVDVVVILSLTLKCEFCTQKWSAMGKGSLKYGIDFVPSWMRINLLQARKLKIFAFIDRTFGLTLFQSIL